MTSNHLDPRRRPRSRPRSRHRRFAPAWVLLANLVPAIAVGPGLGALDAQTTDELRRQAEERLGRPVADEEIVRRLRESGMGADEIRRELELRGVDRRAADPWLSVMDGRSGAVPAGSDPLPVLQLLAEREARDGRGPGDTDLHLPFEPEPGPPIFGRSLFRAFTTQFDPVAVGPAPPDYRIGPGDELILVITGDVELAHELPVTREGWIVIPDVGRLVVHGRTMDELRDLLHRQLSRVYSGIRDDGGATTFFEVMLGRLRMNEVFVIGDVERPSAYQLSSLGTALTALYRSGGPSRIGSFRNIQVNRGDQTVARIDLYEYLVRGRATGAIRLEHGDVLFVPAADRRVELSGMVARPGLYEMREDEDLRDLLLFAGGVDPAAELRRVQIERILPAGDRAPGRDRTILDVPVGRVDDPMAEPIRLHPGDRVTIFAVLDEVENEVRVSGGVWRPGVYAVGDETRLSEIIERAGGLLPDVVEGRVQIQRLERDWTRRLIPVSVSGGVGGLAEDPLLEPRDEVIVYAARDLREDRQVSIGGWVREPGVYPLVDGMTVADLILQAGGLRTGAYLNEAEVSRVIMAQSRTATLTERFGVPLDSALVFDETSPDGGRAPSRALSTTDAAEFSLRNLDAVYVRKAPGFDPRQGVVVTGEVLFPGPYSIANRMERISDLLERAGGLNPEAYAEGFQLWRVRTEDTEAIGDATIRARFEGLDTVVVGADEADQERRWEIERDLERTSGGRDDPERVRRLRMELDEIRERERLRDIERRRAEVEPPTRRTRVGIDLTAVLASPGGMMDILIHPGDSIHVPGFIPTVEVRGAVAAPTKVLYRRGAGLDYYIRQAGGYLEDANERRVRVEFANGQITTRGRRVLFIGGGIAAPDPGSVITVPRRDPLERRDVAQVVALASTSVSALATLIIALTR